MREAGAGAVMDGGKVRLGGVLARMPGLGDAETFEDGGEVVVPHALVERHTDQAVVHPAQVDAVEECALEHFVRAAHAHGDGVEKFVAGDVETGLQQLARQPDSSAMHAQGDFFQPLRPVIHGIHGGHDGEQHLCGADVAGGLLTADVLLARLQGEAAGGVAGGVFGHTDEAAGQAAFESVFDRHEGGVRTAKTERHAEALAVPHTDVRAELSRRAQQGEREQIRRHHEQRARLMHGGGQRREVTDHAECVGVLHEHGGQAFFAIRLPGGEVHHLDTDAQRAHARAHHGDAVRVALIRDDHAVRARDLGHREAERLGAGGALIEQGGIGHVQPGEVGDHGLEVQQRLQPALADLGLVGGVGGVPAGIFQDVPLDDRRREGVVVAEADEAAHHFVPAHHLAQTAQGGLLIQRLGQVQNIALADGLGHHLVNQCVERVHAQTLQHGRCLFSGGTDVTGGKGD